MPRRSRKRSESGYYHIVLRGVNRQDIFFDNEDREKMLKVLRRYQDEMNITIHAWCLMSNHIHLLISGNDDVGLFVKKIASSYVYYFNRKYDRVGHLFQDRYRSEAVETEAYLLTVFRYILQNPAKAGICKTEAYVWSSWKTIEGETGFCDIAPILTIAGGQQALRDFVIQENNDDCLETEEIHPLSEREAYEEALRIAGGESPLQIAQYPKENRNDLIAQMKKAGMSVRQISRITGINRNIIQRV